MIKRVREFRKNKQGVIPPGPKRRKKLGKWIGSNDYKPIMKLDFKSAVKHSEEFGFNMPSSHHMRKIYGNAIADKFSGKIFSATGRRMDRSIIMYKLLSHMGSLNTTLNYETVEIDWPLDREELVQPDKFLLRKLLVDFDAMKEKMKELEKCCDENKDRNDRVAQKMKIDTESPTDEEKHNTTFRKEKNPS